MAVILNTLSCSRSFNMPKKQLKDAKGNELLGLSHLHDVITVKPGYNNIKDDLVARFREEGKKKGCKSFKSALKNSFNGKGIFINDGKQNEAYDDEIRRLQKNRPSDEVERKRVEAEAERDRVKKEMADLKEQMAELKESVKGAANDNNGSAV